MKKVIFGLFLDLLRKEYFIACYFCGKLWILGYCLLQILLKTTPLIHEQMIPQHPFKMAENCLCSLKNLNCLLPLAGLLVVHGHMSLLSKLVSEHDYWSLVNLESRLKTLQKIRFPQTERNFY